MSKNNRIDIYAGTINKYNGGSDVSESYFTGKKREILQLTEIYQYEMKQNFSLNWKVFPKCSDTDGEKLEHMDNGEEFVTITIKVKNITLSKEGKNLQLTNMEAKFRLLLFLTNMEAKFRLLLFLPLNYLP